MPDIESPLSAGRIGEFQLCDGLLALKALTDATFLVHHFAMTMEKVILHFSEQQCLSLICSGTYGRGKV